MLTAIPADLGNGGAHLAKDGAAGSPDLRTILEEHRSALEALGADGTDSALIQKGTGVLVAGVSAAIAATITASSRIQITRKDKLGTALGELSAPSADRSIGAPGSFKVRAWKSTDATAEIADLSTFDWTVDNT